MRTYKQRVLQVTLSDDLQNRVQEVAKQTGTKPGTVGRLLITKGLQQLDTPGKAQELVDSGFCPDLAEAEKLLRYLTVRT